ncbi:pyruvate formate lyase family protein [Methylomonas sp. DH-1]|uniref:pyruvate formate lyase family protein n=1 Tax=Methylomonas sp. (strain DH-1) TaxID=1727196 RepID=UPI0007C98975|nr:pyruvate formate lyase family protein [Methylomonas sp. DH-1]ANE57473.1 formate acetyltransferase [Methylomonas sp. DH-1]
MSVPYPSSDGGISVELEKGSAGPASESGKVDLFPIANPDFEKVKTLKDLALRHITLAQFPVVGAWREKLFAPEGTPEICDELPRLLTEFLRRPESQALPPYTRRAMALQYIFSNKTAIVHPEDLLPGQTTTSFVGPVVYADTIGYCIWPELKTVTTRAQNPFKIRPEVADRLNREIFPFWLEQKPIQELARYSDYDSAAYENRDRIGGDYPESIDPPLQKRAGETPKAQELMERVAFFLSDKATCVSHTVPDFERVLKYGFDGLIERAKQDIASGAAATPQQVEFLQGVIEVYEGAKIYAQRLAEAADQAGNQVLATICRKVPARPAETLHEALAVVWICYHLLLQENTNFGFSVGRLDQILNPFYLADWQKLDSPQAQDDYSRRAVELVCHFFLHCSDHVPLSTTGSETLFAGSGSNQALTVGGTRYENGQVVDAVNDMTYIILKATEILAIRDPNVHARYHRDVHHRDAQGNPLPAEVMDPYLKRICQVNILTRATPALHGDAAVVPAMASYYAAHAGISSEEALADAYDYTSIGCIEENAAHKHYGNTGSTLMVLPAVLELALYGGKHRSDGVAPKSPNLFYGNERYTTAPLTKLDSMQAFIEAFKFQLNEMARHVVQCNNYFGRFYEQSRQSPFLSGLFTGPTNTPDSNGASFRDLTAGGAKYNSAGIAVIGLADVIDSFCVLDSLVFGGKISAGELLAAMQADFDVKNLQPKSAWAAFREWLQNWLHPEDAPLPLPTLSADRLNKIKEMIRLAPKYGAGVDQTPGGVYNNATAVKYTHLLTEMLQEVFAQYRTHRGGRYLPGYWSMTNHAGFGMLTKATPNGRRSGESFASGITPCPGVVKANGEPVNLLDHMLSVTSVNANTVQNGYTYNLSLTTRDRAHFEDDTELFSRYMKAFADQNGVLVQMCVSSINDLVAADRAATTAGQAGAGEEEHKALEPFKDLMIRVAGYSAYFVTLSPQMRKEIIQRANFGLDSGVEQHTLNPI